MSIPEIDIKDAYALCSSLEAWIKSQVDDSNVVETAKMDFALTLVLGRRLNGHRKSLAGRMLAATAVCDLITSEALK